MALTQEDLQSIQNLMFGMEDRLITRMSFPDEVSYHAAGRLAE